MSAPGAPPKFPVLQALLGPALGPATCLQRADELTIELGFGQQVSLKIGDSTHRGNRHTLNVIEIFDYPRTVEEGLSEVCARSSTVVHRMGLAEEIKRLVELGLLRKPDADVDLPRSRKAGFDGPREHILMLNDRARTRGFQRAIRELVREGDVVLDIGTGTGVLAMTAAQAGAKKVYAIDRSRVMPKIARRLFEANGVADRIELIEGDSEQVELPEQVDLMVSEMVGNDPLAEGILPMTSHAVWRFLKPAARLIPGRLKIYVLPLSVPEHKLRRMALTPADVDRWRADYGIDFTYLQELSRDVPGLLSTRPQSAREWQRVGPPQLICDLDLFTVSVLDCPIPVTVEVDRSGTLSGMLVYFEIVLSPGITLSLHPDHASPGNHWTSKVWVPGQPLEVTEGDTLEFRYDFDQEKGSRFELVRGW